MPAVHAVHVPELRYWPATQHDVWSFSAPHMPTLGGHAVLCTTSYSIAAIVHPEPGGEPLDAGRMAKYFSGEVAAA